MGKHGFLPIAAIFLAAGAFLASVTALAVDMSWPPRPETQPETSATPPQQIEVQLADFSIQPKAIEVSAGQVKLEVKNAGSALHTLEVKGTGKVTPTLMGGQESELDLGALKPGSYTLQCTIPGHLQAGMVSNLTVKAAGSAVSPAGSQHPVQTGGAPMPVDMDAKMAERTKAFPAKTQGVGGIRLDPTVLADGTKQFELTASIVDWEVEPGKVVQAWAYNGMVPGPTLVADVGDRVRVVLHNSLPESTAIHFHGVKTPNAADGVPDITQPPVKPGQSYTYEFVATEAGVGMYHSHHHADVQIPNGLAGAFLIGHLPVPAGPPVVDEIPMMLNDSGAIGLSLNGKSFPATAPVVLQQGQRILVHYLNEGVQAHPMHLHGLNQWVVAKDGFSLPTPQRVDTVTVAPGERWTVLVEADLPGTWAWHCHILPHAEREDGMFGMVTAVVVK